MEKHGAVEGETYLDVYVSTTGGAETPLNLPTCQHANEC